MMEKSKLHRVQYKMEPLGLDDTNTDTLEAVYRKLSRDYLGFFSNISKGYTVGGIKGEADATIKIIKQTLQLLSDSIDKRVISKEDAVDLDERIEQINQSRDFIIGEAVKNKRLKSRLQNISEKTGISPGDLNITKEVVKTGVSEARRKPVRTAAKSVWRALERPREISKQAIRTGVTAVAGPFTPLLTTGYGALKGILGLGYRAGRAIYNQRQENKREQLAARLRPMSTQISKEQLQYIARLRQTGSQIGRYSRPYIRGEKESGGLKKTLSSMLRLRRTPTEEPEPTYIDRYYETAEKRRRGDSFITKFTEATRKERKGYEPKKMSKEDMAAPLTYFFDKKADGAKWTKEILNWIKDTGKTTKKTHKRLSGFLSGLSPLKLAGLAVGVGNTIYQFAKLKDAAEDLIDANERRKKSAEDLLNAQQMWLQHIQDVGIEETAKQAGKTPRQLSIEIASREQKAAIEQWASRSWWQKSLSAISRLPAIGPIPKLAQKAAEKLGRPEPGITPVYQRAKEIESMKAPTMIRPERQDTGAAETEFRAAIEKLKNSIFDLSKNVGRDKETPAIRDAGIGNIFDSGDVLINDHAEGRLSID